MPIGEIWPDVMNLVRPEPRDNDPETIWIATDPDMLYPKMFEYMMNRIQRNNLPDPPLTELYQRFKALKLHNRHLSILKQDDVRKMPPVERAIRSETLEILRLYFTELIHRAIGGRIGIHITKDLRYRL